MTGESINVVSETAAKWATSPAGTGRGKAVPSRHPAGGCPEDRGKQYRGRGTAMSGGHERCIPSADGHGIACPGRGDNTVWLQHNGTSTETAGTRDRRGGQPRQDAPVQPP